MSEYSEKMVASAQRRYNFGQWPYQQVYSELVDWMAIIYETLSPESVQAGDGLPSFEIKKMGRTIVSKYKHAYTGGGTLGMIAFNTLYVNETPTENQLIYFVMLLAHDLCQCVAMRKKTDKKVLPHGKEVKQLLEKVGLVWNGPKAHLTFTENSWLKTRLQAAYPDAMAEISYPQILPPPAKKEKPQQFSILDQVDQAPTSNLVEASSNASKNEQQPSCNNGQPSYEVLLKTCAEQLKTIQELRQRIESFNPSNIQQEQPQELANAAN